MGKKGGGLLHQARKAAKQENKQKGPAAKRHKTASGNPNNNQTTQKQKQQPPKAKKAPQPRQHLEPTIPFSPQESILLIGEGDLSFAASLASHHKCTNLTATVLERTPEELLAKYPHVQSNIDLIRGGVAPSSSPTTSAETETESQQPDPPKHPKPKASNNKNKNKILYGIDARNFKPFSYKIHDGRTTSKTTRGTMDRIIFNFPHVGGKSTDVNRQVRYNQEMLVDFFKRATLSLAPGGSIIVTLFEGEPYTLWNIRDLARHSGLQVERSFRFQGAAYPGYKHARTLGVVRKGGGEGEVSEGAWKGEEREARSYVFVRGGEGPRVPGPGEGRKRRRGGDGDGESSDEEEEGEDDGGEDGGGLSEGGEEEEDEGEEQSGDDESDEDDDKA